MCSGCANVATVSFCNTMTSNPTLMLTVSSEAISLAIVCWTSPLASYLCVFYLLAVAWCCYNSTAPLWKHKQSWGSYCCLAKRSLLQYSQRFFIASQKKKNKTGQISPRGHHRRTVAPNRVRGFSCANKCWVDFCRCSFRGEMIWAKLERYDLIAQASCSAAQIMQMLLMPHSPNK